MVGNRWESSNRPLFIRTIWKDGHHVVLRKDEPIAQIARSARRNPQSSRSSKKSTQPAEHSNFKVPSVKVLLANLRNINTAKPTRCKSEKRELLRTLTVDIAPGDSVRLNNLNKQILFKNEKPKGAKKPTSVEVRDFCEDNASNFSTPRQFSYDNYWQDQFNSSLSERVLIWLDLAVQNHKQFRSLELDERVVTAQACPIVERQQKLKREVSFSRVEKIEGETPMNLAVSSPITPQMEFEEIKVINLDEDKEKTPTCTSKRQLHIFLPELPKKSSESGSFVSSKSSSLLQQTNKL